MTALAEAPRDLVEFVNREIAEAEAARAIELLNHSDESKVEAWFAMQAVADQVGTLSNVGTKGICWTLDRGRGFYSIAISCKNGSLKTKTGAPPTLEEARTREFLGRAVAVMNRKAEELGGFARGHRPKGTLDALVEAVSATSEGRDWMDARTETTVRSLLSGMVSVADQYGRNGVNPAASLGAHLKFITFDDRAALVRDFPTASQAQAKYMALKLVKGGEFQRPVPKRSISAIRVANLAVRSGVDPSTARAILRAKMNGCSQTKLLRAVKMAEEMFEES